MIGFDNERHVYGEERYPAQLVLQDVLTIHGRQFKGAALIVASPPCQAYSYRAMPWKRAKALPPPDNSLFEACFRIQREAIEAAGHFIPLVVENVRGAQKYVGRSKYHFGSFHLWGDVPALMPVARGRKNSGGSWFDVSHNNGPRHNAVNDFKVPGFRFDGSGKSFQSAAVEQNERGVKGFTPNGGPLGKNVLGRKHGSKSKARKRVSAMIAKIPLVLSRWIAASWYPREDVLDCVAGQGAL